jgi:Protein of unknown function (DUF3072)
MPKSRHGDCRAYVFKEMSMTDKHTQEQAPHSNMQKDPSHWVTGDEPMTGAQRSYLTTLSEEAGQPVDENLTKAQASQKIEELQAMTGRGNQAGAHSDAASGQANDNPLESFGRSVTDAVVGSEPPPRQADEGSGAPQQSTGPGV